MPSTYTSRLRLTLPATGELINTWGTTVNTGITELVDASIAGAATISTWGGAGIAYTLSNNNGVADEARCMFIVASGAPGENKNIICPAVSKLYVVVNSVTGGYTVTLKTAAGTGITVENGKTAVLRCDGTNVVNAITQLPAFAVAGGTANQVQYLNASRELTGSANLTFNGTTLTANSAAVSTGNLSFSGTAQRITGDMSNATQSNRLAFQTSTTNGNTSITLLPNGTGAQGALNAFNNSDPTNAGYAQLRANATEVALDAGITGTGAYLPMNFRTNGSERMRIDTSGNVGIGTASPSSYGKFAVQGSSSTRVFYADSLAQPVARYDDNSYVSNGLTIRNTGLSGSNQGIGLLFQLGSGGTAVDSGAIQMRSEQDFSSAANQDAAMTFYTVLNGTSAERFRITSTGAITSVDLADAVGYKGTPINEQSAAYGLQLTDQGKTIVHPITDNNARTFTIPANGSIAFPVGTTITFINMINTVTIAITTDTMYLAGAGTTGSRTLAAYGMATAVKITSTSWIISGNGLT